MTDRDDVASPPTIETLAAALLQEIGTRDGPEPILILARQLNEALARQSGAVADQALHRGSGTGEG